MVFSSPTFLLAFLPIVLLGLALVRVRWFQAWWLLGLSVLFYIWGAGGAVGILVGVTLASWGAGFLPWQRWKARPARARVALAVVILVLLCPILYFKYLPPISGAVGIDAFAAVAIPLGISFFTFHAISYVVDVSRGGLAPERSLRDYLLYLFLFPHQIAGPIVRYSEIVTELKDRRDVTLGNATYGLTRFSWGLAKKAYIADSAAVVADAAFSAPDPTMNAATAWIGARCLPNQRRVAR